MPHQKVLVAKEGPLKEILQLHSGLALLAERPGRVTHPAHQQTALRRNLCSPKLENHQLDAGGQTQDRLQTNPLLNPSSDPSIDNLFLPAIVHSQRVIWLVTYPCLPQ